MLKHRLIVGLSLSAVLLGIFILDERLGDVTLQGFWREVFSGRQTLPPGLLLLAVALVLVGLGGAEMAALFRAQGIRTRSWLTVAASVVGLIATFGAPVSAGGAAAPALLGTALVLVFAVAMVTFAWSRDLEGVAAAVGAVLFAMVHLGVMCGFLLALRHEHSGWWIVGVIALTKICDTGAYFTGRAIGRRKMIPWLSPGKTWEGLTGGVLTAAAAGGLLAWASQSLADPGDRVPPLLGVICGIVFALVGQLGDLAMSLLKRGAGVKDSSRLLPGLGGVLDVLDSPLLVAPVAYWMLAGR